MIPQEPVMLLSFVSLKLRDYCSSLDMFCEDLDIEKEEILQKLGAIGYHYDKERNQFG